MYRIIKRLIDILVGLIALPFIIILILIIGLLIKIDDGGPIFYCAERLGKNGKIFKMIKFRSMKVDAKVLRSQDGQIFASDKDNRITKMGNILRKTSIDEVPQFLNVLKGDMSLIGPRAHMVTDAYVGYNNLSEDRKKRLKVKPGITGYNQAYFRNSVSAEQKILNDCYYVDNISLWLDIKIIFKTIFTVLSRKNINTNTKKIMILGASILQVPLIKKAKELGYYVIVLDMNSNAIGVKYADEFFEVSTIDIDKVLEVAKQIKPNGIVTAATDMPMRCIGKVNDELGLNGISYDVAINSTDKFEMISKFKMHNVPSPWFYCVDSIEELNYVASQIKYPVIMKPVDSSGSRGVVLVRTYDEMSSNFFYSKQHSKNGKVLIEEYMIGKEISVEVLVENKKIFIVTMTEKITSGSPHFVEIGHIQPARFNKKIKNNIVCVVENAIKALGIDNGAAHVELMITEDGAKIIEVGARLGGDFITSDLVPLSTGVDMLQNVIRIACGEKINVKKKINKVAIIKFLYLNNGTISSISGVEEAKEIKNVKEVCVLKNVGDEIQGLKSSTDRIGYIIVQAKNLNEANLAMDKAVTRIQVNIK